MENIIMSLDTYSNYLLLLQDKQDTEQTAIVEFKLFDFRIEICKLDKFEDYLEYWNFKGIA